ncbi:hypothetical protein ABBQ32_012838 [Trebouxia sp. C0010 RCD-2024]
MSGALEADQASSKPVAAGWSALGQQAQHFRCQVASGIQQRFDGAARAFTECFPQQRSAAKRGFTLHGKCKTTPRRVMLPSGRFASVIPGNSVAEQVITTGLSQFLSLYNTAIIVRLVLTWFPNPPQFIAGPLSTLCDPYLNLFRGIIPPLNGTIDLSPILAFIALDLFSSTAAALPAELGPDGKPMQRASTPPFAPASRFVMSWRRRMVAQRSRRQQQKQQSAQQ